MQLAQDHAATELLRRENAMNYENNAGRMPYAAIMAWELDNMGGRMWGDMQAACMGRLREGRGQHAICMHDGDCTMDAGRHACMTGSAPCLHDG